MSSVSTRRALEDEAGAVGYKPFVLAFVPDRFSLVEVTISRLPDVSPTGLERSNPPSADVVNLVYKAGLDV